MNKMANVEAYRNFVMAVMYDKHKEDLLPLGITEILFIDTLIRSVSASSTVPERTERIVRWRFGLDGEKLILKDIGKRLGITGGRVQQIEAQSIKKLRFLSNSKKYLKFIFQEGRGAAVRAKAEAERNALLKHMDVSVEELLLGGRAYNVLRNEGIKTLGELAQKTEGEILAMRNAGRKTLYELKDELARHGLHFPM